MKETFEWIQSWCDHADKNDLPRVLLVGDSITRAYREKVGELLRGKYYVDYIATSYAIDQPIYVNLITAFAKDSDYALIYFNHGLHGLHMTDRVYGEGVEKLLADIGKGKKSRSGNVHARQGKGQREDRLSSDGYSSPQKSGYGENRREKRLRYGRPLRREREHPQRIQAGGRNALRRKGQRAPCGIGCEGDSRSRRKQREKRGLKSPGFAKYYKIISQNA